MPELRGVMSFVTCVLTSLRHKGAWLIARNLSVVNFVGVGFLRTVQLEFSRRFSTVEFGRAASFHRNAGKRKTAQRNANTFEQSYARVPLYILMISPT